MLRTLVAGQNYDLEYFGVFLGKNRGELCVLLNGKFSDEIVARIMYREPRHS